MEPKSSNGSHSGAYRNGHSAISATSSAVSDAHTDYDRLSPTGPSSGVGRSSNRSSITKAALAGGLSGGPTSSSRRAGGGGNGAGGGAGQGGERDSTINLVTYRNSTIKAIIDPTIQVQDVIRQLCANAHLGCAEPPALFALRDEETDELIDDSNLARKISAGTSFKLCSSPMIEAVEMVDKLSSRDERTLKMATYTLQRLIRERAFTLEFLRRGGLVELINIIRTSTSGNTLAYALASCQNLLETMDEGWEYLPEEFIAKIVKIVVEQERINVCRPATAILKKLVVSGPSDAPENVGRVLAEDDPSPRADSAGGSSDVYRYGFEVVYANVRKESQFLSTLVQRLGSPDNTLCMYSLSLINSLIRHVTDKHFEALTSELEGFGISRAVTRLMDSNRGDELSTSILEYQNNYIRMTRQKLRTAVTPADKRHVSALSYIWLQAKLSDAATFPTSPGDRSSVGTTGTKMKWRKLGFYSENVAKEFAQTGLLGLECCESFAKADPEAYAQIVSEQLNRPDDRRCPFGRASIEVTDILAAYWNIESGYTSSTEFMPFLLSFHKVHNLALHFFLRMWNDSGAAASDFSRVSALVRSQVRESLRKEGNKTWLDLERDFLESDYRHVRDRQMREIEVDDDFSSKASIRNLRGILYRESYEFVRQQRIHCLLEGAWFRNIPIARSNASGGPGSLNSVNSMNPGRRTALGHNNTTGRAWRFYRLSPNRKYLHYCEASERKTIRGGLDDLRERIDLSLVSDIATVNSGEDGFNGSSSMPSLTFSLMHTPDTSLADLTALNAGQFSEWVDGLGMLRGEGGVVSTKETDEYIQILTDIGLKVRLLDLTGEKTELPNSLPVPPLPTSTDFFFADL
ncbi:hypothetical protein OC846_001057 [Tilletia horrida]|uniref:ELMO domain-containing protein n=1 Tax=Tilletia horrida TaxID=155126 RepID=A0AAN6GUV5_9BASI|nr:hypothetical protein OC845_000313 [Tilletia horrida]KAK0556612.1 hypothetical protein OC846_001057 [Tilletia horrida]KAK0569871.1 hypothetical protein OC861_000452 [Tilletia horrida]